ncbi:hypothetical protein QEZ47_07030 [Aminobacter anthyllidis]|uniref:hypothetical protein n=1 Tax=Aminobacter anthyllidis TaxID=1035067 RepID=UPI00245475AB|nr:hypothetical protein [Aminobacter anthyllidis]MDH4985297.1 hypothetical protein [Aminobacter anthyllidis]
MTYARKIVLHLPVSRPQAIGPFVEQCLRDGVSLIAIVGENARGVEDLVDAIVVGDGSDPSRFVVTTAHQDEAIEDVLEFASHFGSPDSVQLVRI